MHILIVGDVASVENYMDFINNNYSIITSEYEYHTMPSVMKHAANVIYTLKTPAHFDATCFENSMDQVLQYTDQIIESFGDIQSVVATHEHTVLPAAMIRTHYSIGGLQEDQALLLRDKEYVEKCLSALHIDSLVFHLEVFAQETGEYLFLEIAGRYPGAGITNLIQKVFGFDLVKASYDLDCQLSIEETLSERVLDNVRPTAMLLIPSPVKKSIIIRGISGMDHLPESIVCSEFYGPGTRVSYSSIDAFQPLARIYLSDSDLINLERSTQQITSQINFRYEEIK